MSLLLEKDIKLLLQAGFDDSDIGLIPGSYGGISIYESPDDYFARELIDNACEAGECDLWEDSDIFHDNTKPYDQLAKDIYSSDDYPGKDDIYENIPSQLVAQIDFLQKIKLGKMAIWQKCDDDGNCKWRIDRLKFSLPDKENERANKLTPQVRKELWRNYAKEEWSKCWKASVESLYAFSISKVVSIKTKNNKNINYLVIDADNIRKCGYNCLPLEAKWVTLLYFEKY